MEEGERERVRDGNAQPYALAVAKVHCIVTLVPVIVVVVVAVELNVVVVMAVIVVGSSSISCR